MHSATSAYSLITGDPSSWKFASCWYVGSWHFYSKYFLFVIVSQHVFKSVKRGK